MAPTRAEIKTLLDAWVEAVRRKDLERLMSLYAPGIVYFDVVAPLQIKGIQAVRRNFMRWFNLWDGDIGAEIRDLHIRNQRPIVRFDRRAKRRRCEEIEAGPEWRDAARVDRGGKIERRRSADDISYREVRATELDREGDRRGRQNGDEDSDLLHRGQAPLFMECARP